MSKLAYSSVSNDSTEVLIEKEAGLLFSSTYFYTAPKPRIFVSRHFDKPKTIELCITRFFRVVDHHYDLHSFGTPTKCVTREILKDALTQAHDKTIDFATAILERYPEIMNERWNHMQLMFINLCDKMKKIVERKNARNLYLFTNRIQEKIEGDFKQSLRDKLRFLFMDDPNTNAGLYFGKNGKELYMRKFYYHSEVIKIVKELVQEAFNKTDLYAAKLDPAYEKEIGSGRFFARLENDMWAQGDKVVKQNKRNIGVFREFMNNNKEELESYLEKYENSERTPEVEKGIETVLGTSISQVKNVCDHFAVNNCQRLKDLYIKCRKEAVEQAEKDWESTNNLKLNGYAVYKSAWMTDWNKKRKERQLRELQISEKKLLFEGAVVDFDGSGNTDAAENFGRKKRANSSMNGGTKNGLGFGQAKQAKI